MGAGISTLATMARKQHRKPGGAVLAEIYAKRQARRPHYLAALMARHNVSRGKLVEDLDVDKSQLSRWLDEEKPATPSPTWAQRLGRYFAAGPDPEDFVDIFADPDMQRFQKMTRGRSPDEIDRMLATLEAAFPAKRAG
jgi:plasmid maintenance system antidote protein VapI